MKELSTTQRYDLTGLPVPGYGLPNPQQHPALSAEEAFALLGVDRSTGYKAIKDGTFPVSVIRIGRLIRVPTAPLLHLLLGNELDPTGTDAPSVR